MRRGRVGGVRRRRRWLVRQRQRAPRQRDDDACLARAARQRCDRGERDGARQRERLRKRRLRRADLADQRRDEQQRARDARAERLAGRALCRRRLRWRWQPAHDGDRRGRRPRRGNDIAAHPDAATDAGAVDVYVTDPAADITTLTSPTSRSRRRRRARRAPSCRSCPNVSGPRHRQRRPAIRLDSRPSR